MRFYKRKSSQSYQIRDELSTDSLKRTTINCVYEKFDLLGKEDHRPVSILPHFNKVYERKVFNQLSEKMQKFVDKVLCAFCKVSEPPSPHHKKQNFSCSKAHLDWLKIYSNAA